MSRTTPGKLIIAAITAAAFCTILGGCERQLTGASLQPWYTAPDCEHVPAAARRVGIAKRTEVLIAYYKSEPHGRWLDGLRAERDAARSAGDHARADALEAKGQASQDVAHRQLDRRDPLTNILDVIGPDLPAIAAAANLHAIYEEGAYEGPGKKVDITERVTALLPVYEK